MASGGSAAGTARVRTRIEVIAHRGANREAPENSLEAFERALEIGVHGIELDVQLSKDVVPVVHHDPLLHDASGHARLSSLTLEQMQARKPIPRLLDVLEQVNGSCRLYVEVKAPAAVGAVVDLLRPRSSWCSLHSFDHRVVRRARELDGTLQTGILLVSYLVDSPAAMRAAQARDVWQHTDFVDQSLVDTVHAAQGRVVAWTVNDLTRARELADMGVDAICTDVPREVLGAMT